MPSTKPAHSRAHGQRRRSGSLRAALTLLGPLAILGVSACTTVEYVPITPECTPPPSPVLPEISKGDLWQSLGDESYRELEAYLNGLWAAYDEQAAMLDALCGTSSAE